MSHIFREKHTGSVRAVRQWQDQQNIAFLKVSCGDHHLWVCEYLAPFSLFSITFETHSVLAALTKTTGVRLQLDATASIAIPEVEKRLGIR
jgi:hypothetical protein